MALCYRRTTVPLTPGLKTISGITGVNGLPFTPKLALFWTSKQATPGFSDTCYWGTGYTDGVRQRATGFFDADAVTISFPIGPGEASLCAEAASDLKCIWLKKHISGLPARPPQTIIFTDIAASIQGFGLGTCTLNWTAVDTDEDVIHCFFIGGVSAEAYAGTFQSPPIAGAQTQAVTSVPFTPTGLITVSGPLGTIPEFWRYGSDFSGARMSGFAFVSDILSQELCGGFVRGYYTGNTTYRYMFRDQSAWMGQNLGAIIGDPRGYNAYVTAFTATGFNLNWTVFTALGWQNCFVPYLALRGIPMWVGRIFQKATLGLQQTITNFEVEGLLLQGSGYPASASPLVIPQPLRLALGAATAVGDQGCAWIGDENGANPTRGARGLSEDAVYFSATPAVAGPSTVKYAEAEWSQSLPLGFELDYTLTNGVQNEIFAVAFGIAGDEPPPPPPPPDPPPPEFCPVLNDEAPPVVPDPLSDAAVELLLAEDYLAETRYLGLSITDPQIDGTGVLELSGNGYARVAVPSSDWSVPANRESMNLAAIEFAEATSDWQQFGYVFMATALTGGSFMGYGPLASPVTILNGQAVRFPPVSIRVTVIEN